MSPLSPRTGQISHKRLPRGRFEDLKGAMSSRTASILPLGELIWAPFVLLTPGEALYGAFYSVIYTTPGGISGPLLFFLPQGRPYMLPCAVTYIPPQGAQCGGKRQNKANAVAVY